jgi:hypothetical protein
LCDHFEAENGPGQGEDENLVQMGNVPGCTDQGDEKGRSEVISRRERVNRMRAKRWFQAVDEEKQETRVGAEMPDFDFWCRLLGPGIWEARVTASLRIFLLGEAGRKKEEEEEGEEKKGR